MLTKRQNLLETIHGGSPDRFVNQYEFMALPCCDPFSVLSEGPRCSGDQDFTDLWGVTWAWPAHVPGRFPVHTDEKKVISDLEEWEGGLTTPPLEFPDEMWEKARKIYDGIDRSEVFAGIEVYPGLFEQTHCLMGMDDAFIGFYSEPEKMHEIIETLTEWEMHYVKQVAQNLHPDALFHHDDWGSAANTFLSPDMFQEFYLEPYKRLYQCYRDNGIQLIVHHCDSFAATYVPFMIEMGIDIWQGGTVKNNIPTLVKQYGGQISFMTGIEAADVDKEGWTRADVKEAVHRACVQCGKHYFIPCQTAGGWSSVYPGVYDAISEEIDLASKEFFSQDSGSNGIAERYG